MPVKVKVTVATFAAALLSVLIVAVGVMITRDTSGAVSVGALALSSVIALIVGALVGGVIGTGIAGSVDIIMRAVDNVTMGDFQSRARVNSGDELERLASSLNTMLDPSGPPVEPEAPPA